MRNTSSGILLVSSIEEGTTIEFETATCCHCGRVLKLSRDEQKTEDGGFCFKCAKLLCRANVCHQNCQPFKGRLK